MLTEQGKLTVAHQARAHIEARAPELSEGTVLKQWSYLKMIEARQLGAVALRDLKPVHLETFYRELADRYAADTVRHVSVFLKQLLRRAVRHELMSTNPADVAELPRLQGAKRAMPLAPEELQAVLRAARGHRLYPIFATIATLGLRHGEVLGLQWGDLDLETGTLEIKRAVVSRGGKPVVSNPKTRASYRTLYLPSDLRALLESHKATLAAEGASVGPQGWVFPNTQGGMLSQHNVRRVWRQLLEVAGLDPKTRIHDLRHTFVSRLIENGADPQTAADLAGHADPRMTLQVYAHSRAEQRKATLLESAESLLPDVAE